MRCLSNEQLDAYLFHNLSMSEHKKIDDHVTACPKCTQRLSQYVEGQDQAGDFVMEESETDRVAGKIIEKLPPYPLSVLHQGVDRTKLKQAKWKKRSLDIMKKTTVAVAGLALVVSLGTMVSPSFANYVNGLYVANAPKAAVPVSNSLFATFENADAGMLHAVKNGFVQTPNLSVTDQGITLEVKEVLADPVRFLVVGTAKDKNGKVVLDANDMNTNYSLVLKDTNGKNLLPKDEDYWQFYPTGTDYVMWHRELSTYVNRGNQLPDKVIVEVSLSQIGETKGKWQLSIPVDLTKAKAATKTVEVNQRHTTSEGEEILLRKVNFAPSGTELVLEAPQSMGLGYELVDDKGEIIAAWDDISLNSWDKVDMSSTSISKNMITRYDLYSEEAGQKPTQIHLVAPITEQKKMTLKLQELYDYTSADLKAKLIPEKMSKEPVKAEEAGNVFTFTNYQFSDSTIQIDVEGTLAQNIASVQKWSAVDETGEKYFAFFDGKQTKDDQGNVELKGKVQIYTSNPPKELTLGYTLKVIENSDQKWEVPIQIEK
ncbi:DUF4179 domain-containing protein [Brevibacillus sp. 179-C9.3 HS]|uniref:DUF4179 domain-containing protein n=1 Tax=unclassified Brevibacillus TaxID=2684853 RepID=UPI0039A36E0A